MEEMILTRRRRQRLFSSRRRCRHRRRRSAISRRVGCCGGDGSRFQCFGSSECFCWRASVNFWMCLSTSSSLFRHGCLSCCGKFLTSGRHLSLISNFFFLIPPSPQSHSQTAPHILLKKMKRLAGNYQKFFQPFKPKEKKMSAIYCFCFSFQNLATNRTGVFDGGVEGN